MEEIDPLDNSSRNMMDFDDFDNFINIDDFKEDLSGDLSRDAAGDLSGDAASNAARSKRDAARNASTSKRDAARNASTSKRDYKRNLKNEILQKLLAIKSAKGKWMGLLSCLSDALTRNGFLEPTDIQKKTLKVALKGRDIIGCAPTGSGKTFAFALPILNYILQNYSSDIKDNHLQENNKGIVGLILAPTRELAMQVQDHLKKLNLNIYVNSVVGGMSIQKQLRVLEKSTQILVATPGRLLEIMENNQNLLEKLFKIKYLVVDEADRMLQNGNFKDLEKILDLISLSRPETRKRQTFLFSATMIDKKVLFENNAKKSRKIGSLQDIIQKIQFVDSDPYYINMASKDIINKDIIETRVDCLVKDKVIQN